MTVIANSGVRMPYKAEIINLVSDWWQFAAFLGLGIVSFIVGRERQRYKVDEVGRDVCRLQKVVQEMQKDMSAMHTQDNIDAVSAATSITALSQDIKYLRESMDEIKNELRRKADK